MIPLEENLLDSSFKELLNIDINIQGLIPVIISILLNLI